MISSASGTPDSRMTTGGLVPGTAPRPGAAAIPAYTLRECRPSPIPVLIAVPHAGRAYPPGLLEQMRHPAFATPRLEDRLVDLVAERLADQSGAALLVAHAPRALIDLNRATDDVDWDMIRPGEADARLSPAKGESWALHRARSGLGLIPRRLPGLGELWKARLERRDLDERVVHVHQPYHTALAGALADLRARWGAALLIDLHSMPPLPPPGGAGLAAEFVVGDRFGAACAGELVASVFAHLGAEGRRAAHNRPYAGGYVLHRHARRSEGLHALQIEIDRRCYLDERLAEPGPGLDRTVALLTGLVRRLAADVAELGADSGSRWRMAAE